MPDEPTLGELWRHFEAMERRMDNRFARLERSLESLQFVHNDVYQSDQRGVWEAIHSTQAANTKLENKYVWVARTVAGALITSAIAAFLVLITTRGGI